ncbi:hypothetical protein CSUI_001181 [Cystoisospora suis]|uniref:Uncharacterized protein n=1 Tax=Cystoisospora suis TaxID=483139 RepID=A0A2C6LBC3_9APIC|nr:hypothetical protein CSUI_001181 [Cystoisospora suis]
MTHSCFSSLPHLSPTLPGEFRLYYSHIPLSTFPSSLSSSSQRPLTLASDCSSHPPPSYSTLSSPAHSDHLPSIRVSPPASAMAFSSPPPSSSSSAPGVSNSSPLSQHKDTTTLYSWEELPSLFQLATSSSPPSSYLRKLPRWRDSNRYSHPQGEPEPHVQDSCPCRCIYTSLMSQLASSQFSSFSSSRLPTGLESTSSNSSPSTAALSPSTSSSSARTSSVSSAVSLQHSSRGEETNWEWECSVCTALQAIAKYHPAWLFESSDFYHDRRATSPDQTTSSSCCSTSSPSSCIFSSSQPSHLSCSSPQNTERASPSLSGSSQCSPEPLQDSTAPLSSSSSCGSSSSFPSCSSLCTAFICKRANSLRSCVARNALRTAACVFRSCGVHLEERKHPCPSLYTQTNEGLLEKDQPSGTVPEERQDAEEAGNHNTTEKSNEGNVLPERRTRDDGKKSRKGGEEEEENDFLLDEPRRRRMVEMCSGLVPVLISKAGLNEKKFLAIEASEALNLLAACIGRLEGSCKDIEPSPLMQAKESEAKWRLLPSILKHVESQQKHIRTSSPCAQFLLELVKNFLRLVVPPVEGEVRKESRRTSLNTDRVRVFTSFPSEKLSEDSFPPCYLRGGSCNEREVERKEILPRTNPTYPPRACPSPSQKSRSCKSTPDLDSSCSPISSCSSCTSVFLNTFALPAMCLPLLLSFSKSSQPQARQASRSALEVLAIALLSFHSCQDQPLDSSSTLSLRHWRWGEEKKKQKEEEEEGEIYSGRGSVSSSDNKTKEEESRNKESEDSRHSSAPLLIEEEMKHNEVKKGQVGATTAKERNVDKTTGKGCLGSATSSCLTGIKTPEKNTTGHKGEEKEQREEGNPTVTMMKVISGSPVSLIVSLMQGLLKFARGEKNSSFFLSSSLCGAASPPRPAQQREEGEVKATTLSHTSQGVGEIGGRGRREEQEREERRRRRQEEEDLRVLRECATSALKRTKMTVDSSLSSFSSTSPVSSGAASYSTEGVGGMKLEKKKCNLRASDRHGRRREQQKDDEETTRGQEEAEEKKEKKKISSVKQSEISHQKGSNKSNDLNENTRKDFVAKEERSAVVKGEDQTQRANEKTQDEARSKEGEGTDTTRMEVHISRRRDIQREGEEEKNERRAKEKSSVSVLASFLVSETARLPDDNKKRERRESEERKNEDEEEEEEKKKRPLSPLLLFSPRKNFGVNGERIKDDEEGEENQRKTEKEEIAFQGDEGISFLSLNSHSLDTTLSPEERRKKRKKEEILVTCSMPRKNSFPLSFSSSPHTPHPADAATKGSSACKEEEREKVISGLPSSLPSHETEKEREEDEEARRVIILQK